MRGRLDVLLFASRQVLEILERHGAITMAHAGSDAAQMM